MGRMFNETPDDNLPDNIHPDHVLWHTNKLAEWLKFSGTSMATTEIQRSVMREAAKRLCHMADNPRNTEQDVIRVFIKLAEMLDEYCMGGTHPKHALEDIRHAANDAANQARALLDMFPKQKDSARIATLESQLAARDAELLRVRTTGHGAAHELDNIAVECGLGHSPKPGEVAAHIRQLREAVEVLADECFTANTTITGNAVCHAQIVNCHAGSYRKWTAAQARTDGNAIAFAAIDAAKAREGA